MIPAPGLKLERVGPGPAPVELPAADEPGWDYRYEQFPPKAAFSVRRLADLQVTTLTLVAGMAPLALGTGPGAEERRSIAIIVIGGQSLSLLLTLIVPPVAYSIFDDLGALVTRRKRAAVPVSA